ncbi:MAG: segregation/condensation protein A [Gammaproteobacteria bacterium]|nr:segregation/condensation protein A [Gammaproteobacteria bacterium]
MPFALVQGEPLTVLPKDLYIPPDALEIFLEAFEGPLDLLLYLIKRQNMDVLTVSIADITEQYMQYIHLMSAIRLELAAEYLVMAAMLAEIKSRMLLPRVDEEEDEEDPRAELVRRLQEYERFRQAAEDIDQLPRMNRDTYEIKVELPDLKQDKPLPEIDLRELLLAFQDVLKRAEMSSHHHISREPISVRERMSIVLSKLSSSEFTEYTSLFNVQEGRRGLVVTFLAILELVKEQLIDMIQAEPYAPIHVKAISTASSDEHILEEESDSDADATDDSYETDSDPDTSSQ